MDISKRIAFLADHVTGPVIADVGCDHAYVCALSVQSGKVSKAYALDVGYGPLEHAKETIAQCHLEDQIIPVLSDGLKNLDEPVDEIVIAGMGGQLIIKILEEQRQKRGLAPQLLLSPHKDAGLVRSWLKDIGYRIDWEQVVEDTYFYSLIHAIPGKMELKADELEFGKHLIPSKDAYLWMEFLKDRWQKILDSMPEYARKRGENMLEMICTAENRMKEKEKVDSQAKLD